MKIEVKNLSKHFKGIQILNDINIEFNEGNIYALIGRNGSGKSVFLKILCGFFKPSDGEILFDGINVIKKAEFPPSTRALIEKPTFLSELSGFENLKLLANIESKLSEEEIKKVFEAVNLEADMNKKFSKYSLGMKQKLGIAQVIMEDPKIMIFDEPFNGIEEKTVIELRELFFNLKQQGKIIIVASHIKEDIENMADIIYEFDNGTVSKK